MATNKKSGKKYHPKRISYPPLVIADQAIRPLEEALKSLLEHSELTTIDGVAVYRGDKGQMESFEAGLLIYHRAVELLSEKRQLPIPSESPLLKLREALLLNDEIDERYVLDSLTTLAKYKQLLSTTNPLLLREVAGFIRKERETTHRIFDLIHQES